MHLIARLSLIALLASGCSDDDKVSCGDACEATDDAFGLKDRTVHDFAAAEFPSEGVVYTLVRVEYGDTADCDEFDETDCNYSTYCGFVVDNTAIPLDVVWVTEADTLFDPAAYCDDSDIEDCVLPGWDLPIHDDPDFQDWIFETDPDDNVLVDCL